MLSSVSRFSNAHVASQTVVSAPQFVRFGLDKPTKGRIEIKWYQVPGLFLMLIASPFIKFGQWVFRSANTVVFSK